MHRHKNLGPVSQALCYTANQYTQSVREKNNITSRERALTHSTVLLVELKLCVGLLHVALVALLDVCRQDDIPVPSYRLHTTPLCYLVKNSLKLKEGF